MKKRDEERRVNFATLEEYPIHLEGIGLHAIKARQKVKEDQAVGQTAKHPKFAYQKDIAGHFHRDEHRYANKEKEIFDTMEDLLDDERIRKKIEELEERAKAKAAEVFQRKLTEVLGASGFASLFGACTTPEPEGVPGHKVSPLASAVAGKLGASVLKATLTKRRNENKPASSLTAT